MLACAHAPQRSAADDEARIRERLRLWVEQFNSRDLAVVRDTWKETGGGKDETFRSFEVWRRPPDGQWKIARWIDAAPAP